MKRVLPAAPPKRKGRALIEHSKTGHCYFKKQPETDGEVEHAINAISVSCIGALRYGGKEENILRKIYELGLNEYCDYKPIGDYSLVIRNIVTFYFGGAINDLGKTIAEEFANQTYYKVVDYLCEKQREFSFTLRWATHHSGDYIKGEILSMYYYKITITKENGAVDDTIADRAEAVHGALTKKLSASNITWHEKAINSNGAPRPTFV